MDTKTEGVIASIVGPIGAIVAIIGLFGLAASVAVWPVIAIVSGLAFIVIALRLAWFAEPQIFHRIQKEVKQWTKYLQFPVG